MRKLCCCLLSIVCSHVFAESKYTTIVNGAQLYSEYYYNDHSKFNGTIVFENGSGTDISEWKQNQKFLKCVKQLASIFMYDRAGLGKSSPDFKLSESNPITGAYISNELANLLQVPHIKAPYILVAHSYGAIYAGYFALKHPSLVKAIILVDPVPRQFHFSSKVISRYESAVKAAYSESAAMVYKQYGSQVAEVAYQLIGFEQAKQEIA